MRFSPRHPAAAPSGQRWHACDTASCIRCGGMLLARVATLYESPYPGVTVLQCRVCGVVETPAMRTQAVIAREAARLARSAQQARDAARKRGNKKRSKLFGQTIESTCGNPRCGATMRYTIAGRRRPRAYCSLTCRYAVGNVRAADRRRLRLLAPDVLPPTSEGMPANEYLAPPRARHRSSEGEAGS